MLFNSITELLARFIVLFTAITVHEYAHGYVAYKLGDPTAKYSGRLSLNPISHLDMWGAICMVLFGFGWAKPVPINPMYFRDRKKGMALTALAGPLANIVLAFASTIIFALYFVFIYLKFTNVITNFIYSLFVQLAVINISFAVFNLIPFPPLDGSKILGMFLSNESYMKLLNYERIGFPILMILSLTGVLSHILTVFITPVYSLWNTVLQAMVNLLL
ncbi:MAG: site-2 protease family protein [Clostridia bacterium]|nr:site-2 protease family protein [Clostridia bacterium]